MSDRQVKDAEFREALLDTLAIVEKLSAVCETTRDMLGMIRLAIGDPDDPGAGNAAQLKVLYTIVTTPAGKR